MGAPRIADAQTMTSLQVGTTPTDTGAQVYYALDLGLFKEAGLDVTVTSLNQGSAIATAVAGGTFNIAQTSVAALAQAHERGLPFTIVAAGGLYSSKTPTSELLVPANSTVRTAADFNGKTIAVNSLQSLPQIAVEAWIDQNGGTSGSVKFYEMPFGQMPADLASGRVDAAFVAEPNLGAALASGARIFAHAYNAIGNDFLISAWFCTADYAKAHPDIVRKFAAAIDAAGRWANTHPAQSAAILEKYTKVTPPAKMVRVVYADRLTAAQVQPLIDVFTKYGQLGHVFPAGELFNR